MYIKNSNCSENNASFPLESPSNLLPHMGDLFRGCFPLLGVIEDIQNAKVTGIARETADTRQVYFKCEF